MCIYRDAIAHGALHRHAFHNGMFLDTHTRTCAHTGACAPDFRTQMPLRTGAFTQGFSYTEELLRADSQAQLHTQLPLHRHAFTQECFTHTVTHQFHTGFILIQSSFCTFPHKYSYAEMLSLHRRHMRRGGFFTHRCVYKEVLVHENFCTEIVLHRWF